MPSVKSGMKNYLIIGGASGIGKELIQNLLELGHNVYATYNETEPVFSGNVSYHKLNVLDDTPDFSFLPDTLHGVVYCPGSIVLKPFRRISPDDFLSDYDLQVNGVVKVIQHSLPALKKSKGGSIVLFSTVAVQAGLNFHSLVSASKGALEGLTRSLAAEFAPTIRVNCIAPSLTDTPMAANLLNTEEKKSANAKRHPLGRVGTPKDIAAAAEYLLTDKSEWVTGQILHVDGGVSAVKG